MGHQAVAVAEDASRKTLRRDAQEMTSVRSRRSADDGAAQPNRTERSPDVFRSISIDFHPRAMGAGSYTPMRSALARTVDIPMSESERTLDRVAVRDDEIRAAVRRVRPAAGVGCRSIGVDQW
jgi:hypothetical protein